MNTGPLQTSWAHTEDALAKAVRKTAQAIQALSPHPAHTSTPPRAYLVGGYVRDLLLGQTSTDADMEIFGVPLETLHATLEKLFPQAVHLVGKSFGIFKI